MNRRYRFFLLLLCLCILPTLAGCGFPGIQEIVEHLGGGVEWGTGGPVETYVPWVSFPLKPTIGETVIYDRDGVRITAKKLEYGSSRADLTLEFENLGEKEIELYSNIVGYAYNSINGHMFSFGYVNPKLAPGEAKTETVSVYGNELSLYNSSDIADFELCFRIRDSENHITYTGPCALKTSLADSYDYSKVSFRAGITNRGLQKEYGFTDVRPGDRVIYDVLGVKIASETVFRNQNGDTVLSMEAENTGTEQKYLVMKNVAFNGLLVYSGNWTNGYVNPGKTGTVSMRLEQVLGTAQRKLAGIEAVSEVSFELIQEDISGKALADPAQITLSLGGSGTYRKGTELFRGSYAAVYQCGVCPDESKYSQDYHVVLVYENLTDQELTIRFPYKGFLVNGSDEASMSSYSLKLPPKSCVLEDMKVYSYSFDDVGIEDWSEVKEMSLQIEVENRSYKTLEDATLTLDPSVTE